MNVTITMKAGDLAYLEQMLYEKADILFSIADQHFKRNQADVSTLEYNADRCERLATEISKILEQTFEPLAITEMEETF